MGRFRTPRRRGTGFAQRSEEHTSELQSRGHLVCRLLLGKRASLESFLQVGFGFLILLQFHQSETEVVQRFEGVRIYFCRLTQRLQRLPVQGPLAQKSPEPDQGLRVWRGVTQQFSSYFKRSTALFLSTLSLHDALPI